MALNRLNSYGEIVSTELASFMAAMRRESTRAARAGHFQSQTLLAIAPSRRISGWRSLRHRLCFHKP
jgi:hypothetical protein